MGNHEAGRAMGLTAKALLATRTNQTALELLDIICGAYKGCDAEFEAERGDDFGDYTHPDGPIGALIIEAFGECRDWRAEFDAATELDEFFDEWWDYPNGGPYGKFRERYNFC